MPYLSRIWLNPLREKTQLFIRNPHALHAAVLGGLARQPVTERVLWRLDTGRVDPKHRHRPELLALTDSRPSWECLVEQAGWPDAEDHQDLVRDYQPLLDKVQVGREFRLRVRAVPSYSTKKPDRATPAQQERLAGSRPRGERVVHRTAAHQLEWFGTRLPRCGLEPSHLALVGRERVQFDKGSGADRHRVVLTTATCDAVVRVTDVDDARRSLLTGLGPAKGYGCGLLTLAPVAPAAG